MRSLILHNMFLCFSFEVVKRAVLLALHFFDYGASDVVDFLDALLMALVLIDSREDYLLFNPAIQHYNY